MKDGDLVVSFNFNGLIVLYLVGLCSQLVDEVWVCLVIEVFLMNQCKIEVVQKDLKVFCESFKIEYVGKFVQLVFEVVVSVLVLMVIVLVVFEVVLVVFVVLVFVFVVSGLDFVFIFKGMGLK